MLEAVFSKHSILGILFMRHASLLPKLVIHSLCIVNQNVISIENDHHLLQRMTLGLGVVEIYDHSDNDEYDSKDDVVLPSDRVKANGVDKGVEEDGDVGG